MFKFGTKYFLITIGVIAVAAAAAVGYPYLKFSQLREQCLDKIDQQSQEMKVTIEERTGNDKVASLNEWLSRLPGVQSTHVQTPEEALQEFAERHKDDPFVQDSLRKLKTNPLPATITVAYSPDVSEETLGEEVRNAAQNLDITLEEIEPGTEMQSYKTDSVKRMAFSPVRHLYSFISTNNEESLYTGQLPFLKNCAEKGL